MAEIIPLSPTPPVRDEARAIRRAARALARRAEQADLGATAFLLDLAALTAGEEPAYLARRAPGDEQA